MLFSSFLLIGDSAPALAFPGMFHFQEEEKKTLMNTMHPEQNAKTDELKGTFHSSSALRLEENGFGAGARGEEDREGTKRSSGSRERVHNYRVLI